MQIRRWSVASVLLLVVGFANQPPVSAQTRIEDVADETHLMELRAAAGQLAQAGETEAALDVLDEYLDAVAEMNRAGVLSEAQWWLAFGVPFDQMQLLASEFERMTDSSSGKPDELREMVDVLDRQVRLGGRYLSQFEWDQIPSDILHDRSATAIAVSEALWNRGRLFHDLGDAQAADASWHQAREVIAGEIEVALGHEMSAAVPDDQVYSEWRLSSMLDLYLRQVLLTEGHEAYLGAARHAIEWLPRNEAEYREVEGRWEPANFRVVSQLRQQALAWDQDAERQSTAAELNALVRQSYDEWWEAHRVVSYDYHAAFLSSIRIAFATGDLLEARRLIEEARPFIQGASRWTRDTFGRYERRLQTEWQLALQNEFLPPEADAFTASTSIEPIVAVKSIPRVPQERIRRASSPSQRTVAVGSSGSSSIASSSQQNESERGSRVRWLIAGFALMGIVALLILSMKGR